MHAVAILTLSLLLAQTSAPASVNVFVSGKEGYHTFRIPSLLRTSKGTLLAFCEGRKTSSADHGDVDLVLKRSTDSGKSWSELQLVYEEGGNAKITIGNPCPVVDRDTGTVWLLFTRNNEDVFATSSDDDGATWTKPRKITESVKKKGWSWYATGPGIGIQLQHGKYRGRLLIPCDHRAMVEGKGVTFSHCIYSDDGGKTWKLGEAVGQHTNECQAVELSDGRVLIDMRNYWGRDGGQKERDRLRVQAWSKDGGHSWGELTFSQTLIEPTCQASLIALTVKGEKPLLLFSNPASKTRRHNLTVRLSQDEGKTWPVSRVLCPGPSAYSCLADLGDGQSVGCLYENGEKTPYEKLTFARFSLKWLSER